MDVSAPAWAVRLSRLKPPPRWIRALALAVVSLTGLVLCAYSAWAPVIARTPAAVSVLWDASSPVATDGKPHTAEFNGVVCPAAGGCVAYGSDEASVHDTIRPLLVTQHRSGWTATTIPLPPGAKPLSSSFSEVRSVGCLRGTCIAAAQYHGSDGALHVFSNTFSHPNGPSIPMPLPRVAGRATAMDDGYSQEADIFISCWSTTGCIASVSVDAADAAELNAQRFELLRFDGSQWTPVARPDIRLPSRYFGLAAEGIHCASASRCILVGNAYPRDINDITLDSRPWTAVLSDGGWTATLEAGSGAYDELSCLGARCRAMEEVGDGAALVTFASDGSTTKTRLNDGRHLYSFDCSTNVCVFAGTADVSEGGYLTAQSRSTQTSDRAAPKDKFQALGDPGSVACTTASSCFAVGGYMLDHFTGRTVPLVEVFSGGYWRATSPSAFPQAIQTGILNGISCSSPTHCVAIGMSTAELWS